MYFVSKILFPFSLLSLASGAMPISCGDLLSDLKLFLFKATEKRCFLFCGSLKEADVKYFPEKVVLGDFVANLSLFQSYIGRIVKPGGLFFSLCLDLDVDFQFF